MADGTSFSTSYLDPYISTQPNTSAFVGNRSLVIHFANLTRLTCANFTIPGSSSVSGGQAGGNGGAGASVTVSTAIGAAGGNVAAGPNAPTQAGGGSAGGNFAGNAVTVAGPIGSSTTDKPPAIATTPPPSSSSPAGNSGSVNIAPAMPPTVTQTTTA
ncbi:Cell surface superoxide dismutase [Cu-Zn] 4 [Recurvomyces mirabilis]|uniref:Cell surface superoxide dismutase [Cu-Zn] 4 n=1 Tax=Recurvomyces mirabilis TaxID=574656 RepID=A0AAE0WI73_9PEZI|nr:Cell surface superoxide dismutase [Cu-Zn] 4 [Recurvomyces mirabilis]KAK5159833.1 Cell surface superoxide dismutase [Cu-Zn] 4 [Recurvomyces mirabilis]